MVEADLTTKTIDRKVQIAFCCRFKPVLTIRDNRNLIIIFRLYEYLWSVSRFMHRQFQSNKNSIVQATSKFECALKKHGVTGVNVKATM